MIHHMGGLFVPQWMVLVAETIILVVRENILYDIKIYVNVCLKSHFQCRVIQLTRQSIGVNT